MKVLWFINVPTSAMVQRAGTGSERCGGHWINQLLKYVSVARTMELGVVAVFPGLREVEFREGDIDYFVLSQPRRYPLFGVRSEDLEKCRAIVERYKPDIIHIHGSERFYGLIKTGVGVPTPTLVSVQGLLGPYSTAHNFFGALSLRQIFSSIRLIEVPARSGLLWQYIDALRGANRETEMLASVEGFLGRTEWDRAHTQLSNPDARYFHVGEILRDGFYQHRWRLEDCERHTLLYTNAGHPCRGIENLLSAITHLRHEFPNVRLRLAGIVRPHSGYGRFMRRMIRRLGLEERVEFLGYLDEQAMIQELKRAHVFTIGSYIENSPNSLAEAMTLGMPCVASYVGGIPDMVCDNETGLLFPVSDVPLLADKIRRVFTDNGLAERLGSNARVVAIERHDPIKVVSELLDAYRRFSIRE